MKARRLSSKFGKMAYFIEVILGSTADSSKTGPWSRSKRLIVRVTSSFVIRPTPRSAHEAIAPIHKQPGKTSMKNPATRPALLQGLKDRFTVMARVGGISGLSTARRAARPSWDGALSDLIRPCSKIQTLASAVCSSEEILVW
jgi:hypothetical protein